MFGIKHKNVTKSTKLEQNVLWFGHEHQNYNWSSFSLVLK